MFLKRNLRTYSHLEDSWEFYPPFTIPSPLSYIPMALLLNHHKNITNLKTNANPYSCGSWGRCYNHYVYKIEYHYGIKPKRPEKNLNA